MFIPVLAYHKIQREFDISVTRVAPDQFERQIRLLKDAGFESLTLRQSLQIETLDPHKRYVVLTFDDAYASVFESAFPILKKYNFKATLFVLTSYVGALNRWDYTRFFCQRHCTWEQIKELSQQGWEIGSHSRTHRNLTALSHAELKAELLESRGELQDRTGVQVDSLSYPYGKYNCDVIDMAGQTGYKQACTLGTSPLDRYDCFTIPRRGVYAMEPLALFQVKLENSRLSRCDDFKQKAISFCSNGSILLQRLKSV